MFKDKKRLEIDPEFDPDATQPSRPILEENLRTPGDSEADTQEVTPLPLDLLEQPDDNLEDTQPGTAVELAEEELSADEFLDQMLDKIERELRLVILTENADPKRFINALTDQRITDTRVHGKISTLRHRLQHNLERYIDLLNSQRPHTAPPLEFEAELGTLNTIVRRELRIRFQLQK